MVSAVLSSSPGPVREHVVFDSGSVIHIVNSPAMYEGGLVRLKEPVTIVGAVGMPYVAEFGGRAVMPVAGGGEITLADTIFVPGCPYSLISQSKAIVAGYYISIMTNEVMNPQGDLAFRLAPLGGLLVVEGVVVAQETHNTLVAGVDELKDKRKVAAEQRAARHQRGRLAPTVARAVEPTAATRMWRCRRRSCRATRARH